MKILLDENIPRKLLGALVAEGHEVHSVGSLRLDGIDNGALYELATREYDFCFTVTPNSLTELVNREPRRA